MKTENLRKLRKLYATDAMMKKAGMDVPKKKDVGWKSTTDYYKHGIYMRCQHLSGILKVAFYLVDRMRLGDTTPRYELFINPESGEFLTLDCDSQKWRTAKVDNLEWPTYTWYSGRYINPEGYRAIKAYLGTKNGGYAGILEYQNNVRADQLKKKHKRETEPWDLMMDQVPEIPKDFKDWADRNGMIQHFIFYEYDRKGVKEGYCTSCRKTVPVVKPKHNGAGVCTRCKKAIQYKSRGKAGSFYTTDEYVYLLQKCEDGFVLREFRARRHYRKGKYEEERAHVFERRRVIYNERLYGTAFEYGLYKNIEHRWIGEGEPTWESYYHHHKGNVYKRTIPLLEKGILARTGLPDIIRSGKKFDPEMYLECLKRKKYLEQLAKSGLYRLSLELIDNSLQLNIKDVKELGKALEIDKSRLKRLRNKDGGRLYLEWLKYEKATNKCIDDDVLQFFEENGIRQTDIEFIMDRMTEKKICNYIRKQMTVGRFFNAGDVIQTWKDYLCMANRMKMNTAEELFYKPKDLRKAHDEAVKQSDGIEVAKRAGEIAGKYPGVDEVLQSIKSKYEYEDKKYSIIVPERIEDIILEGRSLGHCIDRTDIYFDRIQRKESFIVFLRKTGEVDKSYYTLEIEPGGTARQKRTTGDKQNKDFEEAKGFIRKWQKEIQIRLTEEDRKLADTSAILRVEEFKEMRKEKKKIWNGHLKGQLLADVLEADLMEVAEEVRRCC